MASCNPGQCPIFPIVNKHDRACFEEETCKTDHDCQSNQKCCENPCGISKCYRTTPTIMETTGKRNLIFTEANVRRCSSK